jgi:hypothetical protein
LTDKGRQRLGHESTGRSRYHTGGYVEVWYWKQRGNLAVFMIRCF